jgi:hypothetical protein
MNSAEPTLSALELLAAVILTILAIYFHAVAAASAGGLWRDEANSIAVATLPRVKDVWANQQNDSFPFLWLMIVRGAATIVGPMNDTAFRILGFLVGSGITAVLWINARVFRHNTPLASLLLFGISPSVIYWGDTMRAYGFGILLILVTCALLWRYIELPSVRRFALCAVTAAASVNVLYYNAVLLFAFCAGGAAVCLQRREWKNVAAVMLIGGLAALSLVPNAEMIRSAAEWQVLVQMQNYNFSWFWSKLVETISPQGRGSVALWIALTGIAVLAATLTLVARPARVKNEQRQVIIFALVSLVVGDIGLFVFLRRISYPTEPWYYLALLAITAVCVEAVFGAVIRTRGLRIAQLALVVVAANTGFVSSRALVRQRHTDVDLIAAHLDSISQPGDVIVINTWYYGITFTRYYHGKAPFITIPPLGPLPYHRYDRLKTVMMMADQSVPAREVNDRIAKALQGGNKVYVVGALHELTAGKAPITVPPAPWSGGVWNENAHEEQWSQMVAYFLDHHARTRDPIRVDTRHAVNSFEQLTLQVNNGWKP